MPGQVSNDKSDASETEEAGARQQKAMAADTAPEFDDFLQSTSSQTLDSVSDDVDAVNVLKAQRQAEWDEASTFDTSKDKAAFRRYVRRCSLGTARSRC